MNSKKKNLSAEEREELLSTLKARFEKNMNRHPGIDWSDVEARLEECESGKLWSLYEMERTGGEPDVIGVDQKTGEYLFVDCSEQSPKGRRSACYDRAALESSATPALHPIRPAGQAACGRTEGRQKLAVVSGKRWKPNNPTGLGGIRI